MEGQTAQHTHSALSPTRSAVVPACWVVVLHTHFHCHSTLLWAVKDNILITQGQIIFSSLMLLAVHMQSQRQLLTSLRCPSKVRDT